MNEKNDLSFQSIITESNLCDLLGISKNVLSGLREKGLPHILVGKGKRIYLEPDVLQWLRSKALPKA